MAAALIASWVSSAVAAEVGALAVGELFVAGASVGASIALGQVIGGVVGLAAGSIASGLVNGAINGSGDKGAGNNSVTAAVAQGILLNTSSTVEPLPVIYGTRRVGGTRCLVEVSGASNELLHVVIALGEGTVSGIPTVYLDGVPTTDSRFSQLVFWWPYTGADGQTADITLQSLLPGTWTSQHAGSGVAYLYVQLRYNASAFSGLPTITADVNGRMVYDPRTGLTVYSNNPALCIRDYLTNTRFGRGISAAYIDDAAIIACANHCDELVSTPAGNQARYTCDGVVNVNATAFDNVKALLSSCRGMLVFSAGIYRLVIDKLTAPGFAFTEDNIVGDWSIANPGRRAKFNRVTAGIYNPANNWQPDFAIQDSPAYRTLDNNRLSEGKIDLPFTANMYRGQQLAGLHLKQSRFGLVVRFSAFQVGMRAEVGDVVTITHTTPGWVAKPFRVMQISLTSDDEVEVTCAEYDDTVYDLSALTTITSVPGNKLPNVFSPVAPGAPTVTETLYQTTGSAGLKTRATVACTAVSDAFVTQYVFESQRQGDTAWTQFASTPSPTADSLDMLPGLYNFRVCVQNSVGARSAYTPTVTKELLGLTAYPGNVANFSVSKVAGVAYGAWALTTDLDVRIGGKVVVRHSTQTTGATWNDGIILDEFSGDSVMGVLPLITGTYMCKFADSTGNYSQTAATFVATEGLVTGYTTVATSTQAPGFTGSKTNLAVVSSALQLDTSVLWDSYPGNIDTWASIDALGQLSPAGTYLFDTYLDLTTVATRRLEASIKALSSDTGYQWDDRSAAIDEWDDIDGAVINDCDVTLSVACTDTDPAAAPVWTAWQPFFVADVTCRAVKFKLDFVSANPSHQIAVSTLTVKVKS